MNSAVVSPYLVLLLHLCFECLWNLTYGGVFWITRDRLPNRTPMYTSSDHTWWRGWSIGVYYDVPFIQKHIKFRVSVPWPVPEWNHAALVALRRLVILRNIAHFMNKKRNIKLILFRYIEIASSQRIDSLLPKTTRLRSDVWDLDQCVVLCFYVFTE